MPERRRASTTSEEPEELTADNFFNSGYFTAGETGKISIDFVYDGGWYRPEVGIFSTEEIPYDPLNNYSAYIKEAANRALSNSSFGYVAISDTEEGAYIKGGNNYGQYQGIKTFNLNPGEKFGLVLSPNGKIEDLLNYPNIPGNKRPLFSLATDNPDDNFWPGQIAEFSSGSGLLAIEDLSVNGNKSDRDYNDIVLNVTGASATVPSLDEVINPALSWPDNNLGKKFNEYINFSDLTWKNGVFKASETGELKVSYLFDGGGYQGDFAVVNLEGLNAKSHADFVKQAAERALSNSELGYVVIKDKEEGALFDKRLGENSRNSGEYLGEKTFLVNPGEEYGFMLVPNGTVEEVFERPNIGWSKRPVFSMSTEAEINTFLPGQFVDLTGEGQVFVFEDVRADRPNFDGDYNDFVFSVSGVEGTAASVEEYMNPIKDWRSSDNGIEFLEIVDELVNGGSEPPTISVELANDTGEDDTDKITSDPSLTGTVIDDGEVVSFELSFTGESDSFVEVTTELESDGSFALSRSVLEEVLGETLPFGVNTVYLRATDEDALESEVVSFEFTLEEEESQDELGPEIESMAGIYGLDAYPDAISLPPTGKRQLSVKVDNWANSPELTADIGDISYVVEDGNVLEVSPEGVITALAGGETNVTVQYGEAEITIPVLVEAPSMGPALVDESGGIVEAEDGSLVMLPPGALTSENLVDLTPLQQQDLSLPVPQGFEFATAFDLEIEDHTLDIPAQLTIPAPADLEAGTEVWFMRFGALPDETGTWNPIWLQEESGVVDADGFIRTSSPPYPGILRPGEYMVVYSDGTSSATLVQGELSLNYNSPLTYLGIADPFLGIGQLLQPDPFVTLPAFTVFHDISTVDVVAIPQQGLPVVTEVGVERAADGLATFETALNMFAPESDPTEEPVLQGAQLKFSDENGQPFALNDNEPVLFLRADNAIINAEDLLTPTGSRFEDLTAKFYVGRELYEGAAIPELSRDLDENRVEVAFKIPKAVTLGNSRIAIGRQQEQLLAQSGTSLIYEDIEYESNKLLLENDKKYTFTTMTWSDDVAVLDVGDPETVVNDTGSTDLLKALIPVGGNGRDRPESVAVTSDNSRVYVPLKFSGGVAVIDPMVLSQVDNVSDTSDVIDPIPLPDGASPLDIAIDGGEQYAYIADERKPEIYVLDIDLYSSSYQEVVTTIVLETENNAGLNRLDISSDDRRLFVTSDDGYIYAVNIDPLDRSGESEPNDRLWREQIGRFETETGAFGISATTSSDVITFTNGNMRNDDGGFGVLSVTNDDPESFNAELRYVALDLTNNYFDVKEAYAAVLTEDASYAFVTGRNKIGNGTFDTRRGGNIGIIKDPLGDNPELVAATRPVHNAYTHDLVLSNDDKYLYVSNPDFHDLERGGVYIFDVEEMINTVENPPEDADFTRTPLDDINPNISIAASSGERSPVFFGSVPYGIAASPGDWLDLNEPASTTTDLTPTLEWEIGRNSDELKEVNLFVSALPQGEGLLPKDRWLDLLDASVFPGVELSVAQKRDLLSRPWKGIGDFNPNRIVTATWKQETGEWYWHDRETLVAPPTDDPANSSTRFTLADNRTLTAGQTYYWAVQAIDTNGKEQIDFGNFETELPDNESDNTFSSVSVITHGFKFPTEGPGIPDNIYDLGNHIAESGGDGLVMRYNRFTGGWNAIDEEGRYLSDFQIEDYYGKPLVLLTDWTPDNQSSIPDSGFTEGAADAFFASLVGLDRGLGGKVEYVDGSLVKRQGAVFNSPLHFIGFSRGTVVTSEMVQRMGTHFPYAGGPVNPDGTPKLDSEGQPVRDLQMTTIDPHDFEQRGFSFLEWVPYLGGEGFATFWEPPIQVWENVTFADNYYQTVPKLSPNWTELTGTPAGRFIENADLNVFLGTRAGEENYENSRAGFTQETDAVPGLAGLGATHGRAVSWYDGTTNLEVMKSPEELYRRLGDGYYYHFSNPDFPGMPKPWYTPDHQKADFELGDENAPWEGIGTGWFYSVLGGGKDLRPESKFSERVPVSFDNTRDRQSRGDFAVPTVFNGNFDIVTKPDSRLAEYLNTTNAIPGWSFHNGVESESAIVASAGGSVPVTSSNGELVGGKLVNVYDIPTLEHHFELSGNEQPSPDKPQNYAKRLQPGEIAVHNNQLVPDWGALRLDVHAPDTTTNVSGKLIVTVKNSLDDKIQHSHEIVLQKASNALQTIPLLDDNNKPALDENNKEKKISIPASYQQDKYKIDYGKKGWESFFIPVPEKFRGEMVNIELQLQAEGSKKPKVYVDNVLFQSQSLKFGNPTDARNYRPADSQNNYLIEKPQYTMSFNKTRNTPNWVSWILDGSWPSKIPSSKRPGGFAEDPDLSGTRWYKINQNDYNFQPQIENLKYYTKNDYNHFEVPDRDFSPWVKPYFWPVRGHLSPSKDRSRSIKDLYSTFLTTNIVPQDEKGNEGLWLTLENHLRKKIREFQHKIYVISGVLGTGGDGTDYNDFSQFNAQTNPEEKIAVPSKLWKVVMGFNKNSTSEYPDYAYAVIVPNNALDLLNVEYNNKGKPKKVTAKKWTDFKFTINELEEDLNEDSDIFRYDFLSNVKDPQIKERLKNIK